MASQVRRTAPVESKFYIASGRPSFRCSPLYLLNREQMFLPCKDHAYTLPPNTTSNTPCKQRPRLSRLGKHLGIISALDSEPKWDHLLACLRRLLCRKSKGYGS